MRDIVERLRTDQAWNDAGNDPGGLQGDIWGEAADEIDRLRADNERLRKILFTSVKSSACTISVSETDDRRIEISVEYSASIPFGGREHFVADTIADCARLMLDEYNEDVRRALEGKDV